MAKGQTSNTVISGWHHSGTEGVWKPGSVNGSERPTQTRKATLKSLEEKETVKAGGTCTLYTHSTYVHGIPQPKGDAVQSGICGPQFRHEWTVWRWTQDRGIRKLHKAGVSCLPATHTATKGHRYTAARLLSQSMSCDVLCSSSRTGSWPVSSSCMMKFCTLGCSESWAVRAALFISTFVWKLVDGLLL